MEIYKHNNVIKKHINMAQVNKISSFKSFTEVKIIRTVTY